MRSYKATAQDQASIAASQLFVALNRTVPQGTPCRRNMALFVPDQQVIRDQQLLIAQQGRVIDHLEKSLSVHKQNVATLTDDLGKTRHRLASMKREKDLLAEEVSFLSSLVVSEVPEQYTCPVQQSTVFLPPHSTTRKESRLDDEFLCDSILGDLRRLDCHSSTVSSLDNDNSLTGKDEEYYDDDSSASESVIGEGSTWPLGQLNKKTAMEVQPQHHSLYRKSCEGLRSSKRHDNLLNLLLPHERTEGVPRIIFVKKQPERCGKGEMFGGRKQCGTSHARQERNAMFSSMVGNIDSLILSKKKRSRQQSQQRGEGVARSTLPRYALLGADPELLHRNPASCPSSNKKPRFCKSV
uniref:Uncharacterized protein n=1 Tax=Grammatophora oceanica TaxID=210454 RepID=A0A7S1Y2H8_9STRA|mmetsp:Transcript_12751/g.18805  ORF Transcript_12751/g.18805 Transcript_12751/m.18805 type:complete len:354 (+) Transcript_12751:265-1326(+)|eukprot:CAMPEP_0194046216 /NCGR_PEP_ID=MMETSP0009_2-20130614/20049_1 /TAXON_ID=210454 /ORGANISM="Grammatophora oceanica, Strain CCMP 410" /LENGTH=353 /DNA_ID=CAMNT_0038691419 /DNA_START=249 /DNA_END=1310 /DNA_ORIENTATION=+